MTANSRVPAYFVCISVILNLVSSFPTPAEVSASLTTPGVAIGTTTAANAVKAVTDAAGTAGQLATSGTTTATNAVKAVTDAAGTAGQLATSGTAAATTGVNTAASTASKLSGTATSQLDSAAKQATGALSGAGTLASGALTTGQGQLASTLGLIQAQSDLTSTFRNGAGEVINLADRGTGYLSTGVRAGATGTGGFLDGGLKVVGIQTPIATTTADAMWRVGESGRNTGFGLLRQGLDGSLYLFDPSLITQPLGGALSSFRLSGGSNSASRLSTPVTGSASTTVSATT